MIQNMVAFFRMLPEFFQVPGFWYGIVYLLLAEALLIVGVWLLVHFLRWLGSKIY